MSIDPRYHKEVRLYLKEIEMETDDGLFFESKSTENRLTVDKTFFDFDFMLEWGIASIGVQSGRTKTFY